jgi:hypothetical protein
MSLGWLAGSSILPKKRKTIEGVTANTMVELKALIYEQQHANQKIKKTKPDSDRNKGIDTRMQKDEIQMESNIKSLDSVANLQKKSEMYNKMVNGEIPQDDNIMVDFLRKDLPETKGKLDRSLFKSRESYPLDIPMTSNPIDRSFEKSDQSSLQQLSFDTLSARSKILQMRREKKERNQKRQMKLQAIKAKPSQ